MDKIFLRAITFSYPVLQKMGVDTGQLAEILRVKLMMDNRQPKAIFGVRLLTKKSNNKKPSTWAATFLTVLMGAVISLALSLNKLPFIGETLYFIAFMVFMSITLISDFTAVLIDTRDQYILMPRPVNDRTLAVSRILHISIYVLRLALLQGLPALIMVGFIDGVLAVPLFFIQILEATFLSIFMVNIIYLLLIKFVSPQRFKNIISYIQIGFSVLIFVSYYLLPRLINVSALENISLLSHWWAYPLPPVWVAALNELIIQHTSPQLVTCALALAGLITPVIGFWLVVKVLAPGFNKRLAVLATSDGDSAPLSKTKTAGRLRILDKLANLTASDPVENAGFKITWKLAARTREFKMRVYPAFAYVPIYFLYFALNGNGDVAERIAKLQNGHSYVFLIYMCTLIISAVLVNISTSEKYKSSWVYYALPISEPGKILSGMYKAIVIIYFLPYCLVIGIFIIAVWGPQAINDIILATLISIIYGMLIALFNVKGLPFSKPLAMKQNGGKMIRSLLTLALIAGVGFGHYYIMKWETAVWILIIPFLLINWVMFHYYKKQTWDNIELSEV